MRLTKNFTKREFKSKDGSKMSIEILENVKELACNLQVLRDFLGEPLRINSAYRSEAHNQAVGGSSRSQHLLGKASDLRVRELDSEDLYHIIEALISEGKMKEGGLGLYNSFVHYDIRGTRARWNFKK
jgi:uncharacterized protein YcbK (DUF882 family)